MPFRKGQSGNPKGRKRLTEQEKDERQEFKQLLRTSTVSALQEIIEIAQNPRHLRQFDACKFIIDKAYGIDPKLLADNFENIFEPVNITIQRVHGKEHINV